MEFQELGEQKARNGSSSVGSSGSKGMSVVWENEVGDEADRWRLQRGLGATVLPVVLHHKIFPFFFFFGVSYHCGLNPVRIRRIEVFGRRRTGGGSPVTGLCYPCRVRAGPSPLLRAARSQPLGLHRSQGRMVRTRRPLYRPSTSPKGPLDNYS